MDVVNNIALFQLSLLGDEWVQQVWESDFNDFDEIPPELEEFLMEKDIKNILEINIVCLKNILKCDRREARTSDTSQLSWELLLDNKVEHRKLLCVLSYFIWRGLENSDSIKFVEEGLKATSMYYLLVAIPGSDAYFVFQASIYDKTLRTFNICQVLYGVRETPSKGQRRQTDYNEEDDEEDCNNGAAFDSLSSQDTTVLKKSVNIVLGDLAFMVSKYGLKTEDTLERSVIQLVSHTRLNISSSVINFVSFKNTGDVSSFAGNSYFVLREMCNTLHGKIEETVRIILFYLLPNILMAGDFARDMSMHNLNNIRIQSERFVLHLLQVLEEESYSSICVFVQHLCARVTDRADYRTKVSQSIVTILNALPSEPYFLMIKWLLQFAHDSKASHRLFSLEVISKLIYEEERPNEAHDKSSSESSGIGTAENTSQESLENGSLQEDDGVTATQQERDVTSHKYLLGILFSRCYDQSGTVRTKALTTLTDCLRSNNRTVKSIMESIFVTPYVENDIIEDESVMERGFMNTMLFLDSLNKPSHQQIDPLPGGKAVVEAILRLIEDDKVFVRKSSFLLLEYIMRLNKKWLTSKLLKVMCDHCRDPALLIKKQLIQSLTDLLLLYPRESNLATQYIDAVLPQISHPELKVQEKVLESLQSTILQNIVPYEKLNSPISHLPWTLLRVIIELKKRKFFLITCSIWAKNNMLPKNLVSIIQSHINTENNIAAWLFLSCVAPYASMKNPDFVVDYYKENLMNPDKPARYSVVKALDVLGTAWKHLPRSEQDKMCSELLDAVRQMKLNITLIGPALDLALLITMGQASSEKEGQKAVGSWANELLKKMEYYIEKNSPCKKGCPRVSIEEFKKYMVTLGDVAMLCPGKVQVNIAIILTGILFPDKLHDPERWSIPGLQALAVITLGKMCLQNECLAKRIVPALGLLLCENKYISVKVNILNALSDMCIRFTAVVEPLLPEMCLCLKDPDITVRHHAVTIFVRLLQQDFLKLRGQLLFHMLSMLVDPLPNIAHLANYFMTSCVVTRNKSIMYQNIVESIFYYNRYESHAVYSKIKLTAQEARLFNMTGPENQNNRLTLYRFMCEHMTDEQRMQTIHKICVDVLGGVTNDTVILNESGQSVLKDAFLVLSCEEIGLHSLRTQSEDEPATDDAERVTAAVNTAKKNLISQPGCDEDASPPRTSCPFLRRLATCQRKAVVYALRRDRGNRCVKKQVIEIIIPILVQLKAKLQTMLSPLLSNLMGYLRNILKDYKNEISDIFAEDKALADEILYDIKQFEEQERRNMSRSQESDDEDGEEDHMRPLLVELATDRLRESINRKGSAEMPLSPDSKSLTEGANVSEGAAPSQADSSGASAGVSPAKSSQSSPGSSGNGTDKEQSSCQDKEQGPQSPSERSLSRTSQKRTIDEVNADSLPSTSQLSEMQTPEVPLSASERRSSTRSERNSVPKSTSCSLRGRKTSVSTVQPEREAETAKAEEAELQTKKARAKKCVPRSSSRCSQRSGTPLSTSRPESEAETDNSDVVEKLGTKKSSAVKSVPRSSSCSSRRSESPLSTSKPECEEEAADAEKLRTKKSANKSGRKHDSFNNADEKKRKKAISRRESPESSHSDDSTPLRTRTQGHERSDGAVGKMSQQRTENSSVSEKLNLNGRRNSLENSVNRKKADVDRSKSKRTVRKSHSLRIASDVDVNSSESDSSIQQEDGRSKRRLSAETPKKSVKRGCPQKRSFGLFCT